MFQNQEAIQGCEVVLPLGLKRRFIAKPQTLLAAISFVLVFSFAFVLGEDRYLGFMKWLESYGTFMAVLETLFGTIASFALFWSLRNERRSGFLKAAALFTLFALLANMADYFGTLQMSPDLAMESSPIWNSLLKDTGFEFAAVYGFIGKVFVSVVAGMCFLFLLEKCCYLAADEAAASKYFYLASWRWMPNKKTAASFFFNCVCLLFRFHKSVLLLYRLCKFTSK